MTESEAVRPVFVQRLELPAPDFRNEGRNPSIPGGIVNREVERWHRELENGNGVEDGNVLEEPEAQPSQGLRRVDMPTPQEVKDHERTHLPFRSWCKHCVFGRAKNESPSQSG